MCIFDLFLLANWLIFLFFYCNSDVRNCILGEEKSRDRFKGHWKGNQFFFSLCVNYFYSSCKRNNVSHLISPFLKRGFLLEKLMFSQERGSWNGRHKREISLLFCFVLPSENARHSIPCFLNALWILPKPTLKKNKPLTAILIVECCGSQPVSYGSVIMRGPHQLRNWATNMLRVVLFGLKLESS